MYADAHLARKERHFIGVKFYNSSKTSLFTRSKAFGTYAVKIPISEHSSWVIGTQVGLANVYYGASAVTSGSSAWGFDASISTTLNLRSWEIGLAAQQIPNTFLTPILHSFKLGRYVEFIAIKNFTINHEWKLKSGLRSIISRPDPQFQIDNRLQYKDIASILFSCEGFDPRSISVGVEYIFKVNEKPIRTTFAYQVSDSRTNFSAGQMMLGIGYRL